MRTENSLETQSDRTVDQEYGERIEPIIAVLSTEIETMVYD